MAASASATAHPDPATASSPQPWILLDAHAHIGGRRNSTTARDLTSNDTSIEVSIWPAEAPAPSRLFVHCPDLQQGEVFRLRAAEGFLLLRVHIGSPVAPLPPLEKGDYFVYRAAYPEQPSLRLLPKPPPFGDDGVGLLARGKEFTIAALCVSADGYGYLIHVFNSEAWSWTVFTKVPVVSSISFPIEISENGARLHRFTPTTVIALDGGTMGWVDLWSGIMLCDVLSNDPTLRGVPLPMPGPYVKRQEKIPGCPKAFRGIAVVQGCLKMAELESDEERIPGWDPETGCPIFKFNDWELTTYTNSKITGSREDWKFDCTIRASCVKVEAALRWELLQSGLLHDSTSTTVRRNLENLYTCQPMFGLDGNKGIVYLLARPKFNQKKAWVIAVDMENNKLQALAEFGTDTSLGLSFACCPSRVSSYMHE